MLKIFYVFKQTFVLHNSKKNFHCSHKLSNYFLELFSKALTKDTHNLHVAFNEKTMDMFG